ncbi:MAG: carboxypeptidase-like regulatory domain-containing protein [Planctomycetota bacterium]
MRWVFLALVAVVGLLLWIALDPGARADRRDRLPEQTASVWESEPPTPKPVEIEPVTREGATILEGVVRGPTGPIARATVRVYARGQRVAFDETATDDAGRYRFDLALDGASEELDVEAIPAFQPGLVAQRLANRQVRARRTQSLDITLEEGPGIRGRLENLGESMVGAVAWERWLNATRGGRMPSPKELRNLATAEARARPEFRFGALPDWSYAIVYIGDGDYVTRDPPRVRPGDADVRVTVERPSGHWIEARDVETERPLSVVTIRLHDAGAGAEQTGPGSGFGSPALWEWTKRRGIATVRVSAPGYFPAIVRVPRAQRNVTTRLLREDASLLRVQASGDGAQRFKEAGELTLQPLARVTIHSTPPFAAPILERGDDLVVFAVPEGLWAVEVAGLSSYRATRDMLQLSSPRTGSRDLRLELPGLARLDLEGAPARGSFVTVSQVPYGWVTLSERSHALRPRPNAKPRLHFVPGRGHVDMLAAPALVEWMYIKEKKERRAREIDPKPGDTIKLSFE